MASTAQDRIPAFYSIFLLWIDPVIALAGAYMHLFDPTVSLDAAVPRGVLHYNSHMYPLFQQLAGLLLGSAWTQIVLQRYTRDVEVWKIVQTGILIVDLVMLYSIWHSLGAQGRRSLDRIRAEDWGSIAILGAVGAIRSAFLTEIGFAKRDENKKRA